MGYRVDLTGNQYGSWIVLEFRGNEKGGPSAWLCKCKCGLRKTIPIGNLKSGKSTQCLKCAAKSKNLQHGLCKTPVYVYWHNRRNDKLVNWDCVEQFNKECWVYRSEETTKLVPFDDSKPLGPTNFKWVPKPPTGQGASQRVIDYLVSVGESVEVATARANNMSHQRKYQIINMSNGKCQCGTQPGVNLKCHTCVNFVKQQEVRDMVEAGTHYKVKEAQEVTGLNNLTLRRYCGYVKMGGKILFVRKDVEALIVPDGWVRASHIPIGLTAVVRKGKEWKRIGGGAYVKRSDFIKE